MDPTPMRMDTSEEAVLGVTEIAALIDNLKNVDPEIRSRSVRSVGMIAATIGPQRTRDELLPFLMDTIDDEEEVQALLAGELKNFVNLVGGPEHASALVPIIESLVSAEDASVRDKATDTLAAVVAAAAPSCVPAFVALFQRLCEGQWFTTRSVAASMVAPLLRASPDHHSELIRRYVTLGQDSTPMVRRSVAAALKDVIEVATEATLELSLRRLLQDLSSDDQDSVRLLVAGACAALARRVGGSAGGAAGVFPTFAKIARDESWRVRYMAADSVTEFQAALDGDAAHADLVALFVELLGDKEAEVRCVSAGKVLNFAKAVPTAHRVRVVQLSILPRLQDLARDESEHTRSSLAGVIMGLAALVGKEITIAHLLPLFLQLLKDVCSDVRLNIISHLEDVNKVIGIGSLTQALLPAVQELAADKAWRVRQAIIDNIPLVARQLGPEFFNEHLMPLCVQWLQDQIFSVRRSAVENLKNVADIFGQDWLKKFALPAVLKLCVSANFMHRLTSLFALNALLSSCDRDTLVAAVLPAVAPLAKDKVPNIRLNVAKTLVHAAGLLDRAAVDKVLRPPLALLAADEDRDVVFFTTCAMQDLQLAV